jgi:hypothetical protein
MKKLHLIDCNEIGKIKSKSHAGTFSEIEKWRNMMEKNSFNKKCVNGQMIL